MSTIPQSDAMTNPVAVVIPPTEPGEPAPKRWTRDEYHRLDEQGFFDGQRAELIFGEIYLVSPQSPQHRFSIEETREILRNAFGQGYWIMSQYPMVEGEDSEPEPDLSVIAGTNRDYANSHPTESKLIVEVAKSSIRMDKSLKRDLYAGMGVEDYWVLDINNRQLHVFRNRGPDKSARLGYRYASCETLGESDSISPLEKPDASIQIADMLPPKAK